MCRVLSLDDMVKQQRKEQSRLLKSLVDEIISHFSYIIKDFRYYDQYLLIESDAWTVQKICKLSILDRTYFKIFREQLTQILPVSKEFQAQVKLSLFHRLKKWFTDRHTETADGKIEVKNFLSLDHVILIFGLLQSPHQRLKLRNVFQVAVQNNLQPELKTLKYFNIADKYDGKEHYQNQEIKNISNQKENIIHRIVLNEWRYVEYYVQETLNYCKNAKILTADEIKALKTTRVEKYYKRCEVEEQEGGHFPSTNSYSQNLTQAILKEQKSFVWLMKLFHRDEIDI